MALKLNTYLLGVAVKNVQSKAGLSTALGTLIAAFA